MTEAKKAKTTQAANKEQAPPPSSVEVSAELLMEEENEDGCIKISESVIATVVRKYTLEVDGVIRFAPQGIGGALAGMVGKRNYESNMVVEMDDNSARISVTLVMKFGVRIPEVAQMVQDVIRNRVEELTGKHVSRVNVIVQELEDVMPEPAPEAENTATAE
jgi:uncharacterized alkaline shock family protein YloU